MRKGRTQWHKERFITGVNSGFSRLMTERLLERGDRLAGTVRKMDSMDDLKGKYGNLLWLAHLDMADLPEIRKVVDKAFAQLGRIDVIVSNAGYGLFGAAEELSDDQVSHQLSTNLFGPIQLVRAALPHLRAQGGGRIIGLSTYGGQAATRRISVPRQQMGSGRLSGFDRSGTRPIQDRRYDHRAGRRADEPSLWRSAARNADGGLQRYPAAMVYTMMRDTSRLPQGDPAKMAMIIIDSLEQNPAPERIALGSDAYGAIHKALTDRLTALEAQGRLRFRLTFRNNSRVTRPR
jgi:NAD(P)-dependent dehydrogenase (short-subunit alcohol dehydrogenase family)